MNNKEVDSGLIPRLRSLDEELADLAAEGLFDPNIVTSALIDMGFEASFYFNAGDDVVSEKLTLYLNCYRANYELECPVGRRLTYDDSAFSRDHLDVSGPLVVVAPSDDVKCTSAALKLAKLLKIDKSERVHLEFKLDDKTFSSVLCSWNTEKSQLPSSMKSALILISSIVEKYIAKSMRVSIDRTSGDLKSELKKHGNLNVADKNTLLETVLPVINDLVGGAVASVFEFDWYKGQLIKTHESYNNGNFDHHVEEYKKGEFLTGTAWVDSQYRYILNFDEFKKKKSPKIEPTSLAHIEKYIGKIESVLYCVFGNEYKNFMIRVFNDHGPDAPFLTRNQLLLEKICDEISILIDSSVVIERLEHLQTLATLSLKSNSERNEVLNQTALALSSEYVDKFSFLSMDSNSAELYYYHSNSGGNFENLNDRDYESSDLIDLFGGKSERVLSIGNYVETEWSEYIILSDCRRVLCIPFSAENRVSSLLIWITGMQSETELRSDPPGSHRKILNSVVTLVNAFIEVEESNQQADAAKNLVATIGHEIKGPTNTVVQTAIGQATSLMSALREINSSTSKEEIHNKVDFLIESISESRGLISQQSADVNNVMNMVVELAQNPGGDVPLTVRFEKYSLLDVIEEAIEEVNKNVVVLNANGVRQKFNFILNPSTHQFKDGTGDRLLLKTAFSNLLGNAVKYSMPPGDSKRIKVTITGIPQVNQNILQITNFGFSIHKNEYEKIFRPFERGVHRDNKNTRRGMGLGLYMVRRIFKAHRGSVYVKESFREFEDKYRNPDEGWLSTFEIRLPILNDVGVFHVDA